jgi:flavin reductase (DIM6/NTAB) family NADH-FMN oxidoreductase RutF
MAEVTVMARIRSKKDFPVGEVRRFLEPGPIVLVSSTWKGQRNIMTMGWHTMMEFAPSLLGCVISSANHSFEMIRRSRECVINIPEVQLADSVIGIGTCSGRDFVKDASDGADKFERFGLTPVAATQVNAPLIAQCFASFECRVVDTRMVNAYNFFVLEVVRAHVASTPRYPKTLHYRGGGIFTLSGETVNMGRKYPQLRRM